jgi:predicted transposase/invertase (TIGR01784 family)
MPDAREAPAPHDGSYKHLKYQALNRAFVVWINSALLNRLMPQERIPEVNDLEEMETMLAERVDEWTEKWKMEGLQQGIQKGEQKGRQAEKLAVAVNALREKIPPETIAKLTGLSVYEIEQIAVGLAD